MSDIETTVDEAPGSVPASPEVPATQADPTDPSDVLRAEIHQEYSTRLVHAELRVQAALGGFQFPDGFLDLLDSSKLLGEDGEPNTDVISLVIQPLLASVKPEFPQIQGAGYHRGSIPAFQAPSLDARYR
ncbi:hypothetical protein ACFVHB_35450 [Kitasatospora sp. NPDC127111]|uniref:hypothetical protein n=1 Tax=Kitasatospora sp. NPDC127111 TaxID=3345363 RepID=UPI0036359759